MPQADPVADRLKRAPIPNPVRADVWDAYEAAADADDLAKRLDALKIPSDLKADLWDLKSQTSKAPSAAAEPSKDEPGMLSGIVQGAIKGVGNTVVGLGELVHKIPGVSTAVDTIYGTPGLSQAAFPAARQAVQPQTGPEKAGYAAEQVGEFFLPGGATGKVGKVAETAGLTMAQTGSPAASGTAAALTAVIPGAGAAARVAPKLADSAEKSIAQALGATKEWAKAKSRQLAPEILKRGIGGSRQAMLAQAREVSARVGGELNAAYQAAAQEGGTIPGNVVREYLATARDALMTDTAGGMPVAIPGTEQVIKRLDQLGEFVGSLGPDIPIDKAAAVKRTWDKIVDRAGLFGQKAGASSTDSAEAWAFREASSAFRDLLNSSPTIGALNKEASFWTGLKKVLTETERRTQPQRGALTDAIRGGAGAAAGAAMGGPWGAAIGGIATQQLSHLIASPSFKTMVSAPLKQLLSDALASGSATRVENAVRSITRAVPSLMTQVTR